MIIKGEKYDQNAMKDILGHLGHTTLGHLIHYGRLNQFSELPRHHGHQKHRAQTRNHALLQTH